MITASYAAAIRNLRKYRSDFCSVQQIPELTGANQKSTYDTQKKNRTELMQI